MLETSDYIDGNYIQRSEHYALILFQAKFIVFKGNSLNIYTLIIYRDPKQNGK